MLNSAIGNTAETDIKLPDVKSGKWYYNDVQKGVAAGFISGKSNGDFAPDAKDNPSGNCSHAFKDRSYIRL